MDSKQMVSDLIAGSDNINRMRKEVEFVVKTVVSFISDYDFTAWRCSDRFRGESGDGRLPHPQFQGIGVGFRWEISHQYEGDRQSLKVECWLSMSYGDSLGYSTVSPGVFRAEIVKRVHDALGTFVEVMMEEFPSIKERLQIFWDAA